MKKRFILKIFGRVQTVGYRFWAKAKADEFGIKGLVRNEPDGSVYIEAEGEENNLEKLVDWCNKGPDLARVRRVEKIEGELKNYSDFRIEY